MNKLQFLACKEKFERRPSIIIVQHVTFEPETFITIPKIALETSLDVEKYFADVNTATASFRSNQFNLSEFPLRHTTTDSNPQFTAILHTHLQ